MFVLLWPGGKGSDEKGTSRNKKLSLLRRARARHLNRGLLKRKRGSLDQTEESFVSTTSDFELDHGLLSNFMHCRRS